MTLLIGILGTVIGFYYGSTAKKEATSVSIVDSLRIEDVVFNPTIPMVDTPLVLNFKIVGGAPPYKFRLAFPSGLIESVQDETSKTASVTKTLKVLKEIPNSKPIEFQIVGSDINNHPFEHSGLLK